MKRKMNKKKKGIIVAGIVGIVLLTGVGTGFFLLRSRNVRAMTPAEALITQVSTGNISTTVIGTGTLQDDTAQEIQIPEGITVKEVLAEAGDKVKTGDTLATLDQASILKKLTEIQGELEALDMEINEVKDDTESETVVTYVAGRVKKIYAEESNTVTEVMKENGSLLLLSLDGKMAVDIENTLSLVTGDTVTVTLSDGDTVTGTVVSTDNGTCVITMTDNGPELEEQVTVQDEEGRELGSGNLYIYRQLEITGTAGTISSIQVSENEKVSAEETLMTLTEVPASTEYRELLAERTSLAETIKELTQLAAEGAIKAEFDGIVQTVNVTADTVSEKSSGNTGTGSAGITTASGNTVTMAQAAIVNTAASTGSKETQVSTVTSITDMEQLFGELAITVPVTEGTPQMNIGETGQYTGTISWSPAGAVFEEKTGYTAVVELQAKAGYQFVIPDKTELSYPGASLTQWEIEEQCEENTLKLTITFPETAEKETEAQKETETQKQTETQQETETQKQTESQGGEETRQTETQGTEDKVKETEKNQPPTETETESASKSTGGTASGTASGGTSSAGSGSGSSSGSSTVTTSTGTENSEESSTDNSVTAFTVSPGENAILSVNIDELDILSIQVGQKATITLDALEDQSFEGELTKINHTATSSGGVTKYTVEITIPKNESMLTGMNASATITIESKENVLLLPADAIQERRGRSFVYTEQGEDGTLSGEVEVETGISDGSNVEITSGLSEEQTVYYNKVESTTSNSNMESMMNKMMNGGSGRGNWGGEAPSGGMPSGGMPSGQ